MSKSIKPFKLYSAPPVTLEIKYGKKVQKGNYAIPTKLDHLIVVNRERDEINFKINEDVHKVLGPNPQSVPIQLLSDNPQENFALFRGFFNKKGQLGCGAAYGDDKAIRRFRKEGPCEPYEVDCNRDCPFWQREKDGCDLTGTLYFRLSDKLPRSNALGVVRVNGSHAQKRIRASLDILAKQTGGILAHLPLQLCLHYEQKTAGDGKSYPIPMLSIEPEGSQREFFQALKEEIERRAEMFQLFHRREHTSLDELRITDVLTEVNQRSAMLDSLDEAPEVTDTDELEETQVLDPIDDEVSEALLHLPEAKRDALLLKFSNDDGSLQKEALLKYVQKHEKKTDDDLPF